MKTDFTPDPGSLQRLTSFESFTEERLCQGCSSSTCPGRKLIQQGKRDENEFVDTYSCFVKARLLIDLSVEEVMGLLFGNRLLRYVGIKTKAVSRTTTKRGAYGNLGTLLILVKDYIAHFDNYKEYSGIQFSDYLAEVRTLPGCSKMQNHAINHRLNEEFQKFFEHTDERPIIRIPIPGNESVTTYKINDNLLREGATNDTRRVAKLLLDILSLYFYFREKGSLEIVQMIQNMMVDPGHNEEHIIDFLEEAITHDDARMFEIAAFVVLQAWYGTQKVLFGSNPLNITETSLRLFKTGRVTANDGGINYVLIPTGKFFQATQTLDLTKFFLDIDKLSRYPITFVIQTEMSAKETLDLLKQEAVRKYANSEVVERYLESIADVFTLRDLERFLAEIRNLPVDARLKTYRDMLGEFVRQYSVEYNLE
jgi:hypothetical protein